MHEEVPPGSPHCGERRCLQSRLANECPSKKDADRVPEVDEHGHVGPFV